MRVDLGLQRMHLRIRRLPDGLKLLLILPAVQFPPLLQRICHVIVIAGQFPDLVFSFYLDPGLPYALLHQLHRLPYPADRPQRVRCKDQLQHADQKDYKHEDPHAL